MRIFFTLVFSILLPLAAMAQEGIKAGEEREFEIATGVKVKFIWCPSGKFTMGDANGAYDVTLSRGFWIAATEVTQAQWQAVMAENPSEFKSPGNPVEKVSWDDAQEFITKIGNAYRLPTEAEWEYACRAGSKTSWCFGDDEALLGDYAWYRDNSGKMTHPVGQKKPNAWGIQDMHGNVWEWCLDWHGDYPAGSATDPKGAPSGKGRVFRGGSWILPANHTPSSIRMKTIPSGADFNIGFRLVRNSNAETVDGVGSR